MPPMSVPRMLPKEVILATPIILELLQNVLQSHASKSWSFWKVVVKLLIEWQSSLSIIKLEIKMEAFRRFQWKPGRLVKGTEMCDNITEKTFLK